MGNADVSTSLVTASAVSIIADGVATSIITVQLKDAFGNNLISGGANVFMSTSAGTLTGVTDNNDGTYNATLTNSTAASTANITATLNGNAIIDSASVEFMVDVAAPDGDLNLDGVVDLRDVLFGCRVLIGLETLSAEQLINADVAPLVAGTPSADGSFNSADLLVIMRKVLGTISF